MIVDPPNERVLVIHRMPDVNTQWRIAGWWNHGVERHQIGRHSPVILVLPDLAACADQQSELRQHHLEMWLQAFAEIFSRWADCGLNSRHAFVEGAVQKTDMARIHVA